MKFNKRNHRGKSSGYRLRPEILELACMTYKTKVDKLDPVKVLWENS